MAAEVEAERALVEEDRTITQNVYRSPQTAYIVYAFCLTFDDRMMRRAGLIAGVNPRPDKLRSKQSPGQVIISKHTISNIILSLTV